MGGSEGEPDDSAVPPSQGFAITASDPQTVEPATETVAPAFPPAIVIRSAPDPGQSGVAVSAPNSELGSLSHADPASQASFSPASPDSEDASARAEAPLDMQALLDAVAAFDAPALPGPGVQGSTSGGRQTEGQSTRDTTGQEVTSWALTNALLEFHLDNAGGSDAGESPADFSVGNPALAAIGTSLNRLPSGLEAFGARTASLATFSGLQEGFTRL